MKINAMKKFLFLVLIFSFSAATLQAQNKKSEEEKKKARVEAEMEAAMEAEMQHKKQMLEEEHQHMKQKQQQMEEQERKMREMEWQYQDQARDMERDLRESYRFRSSGRSTWVTPDDVHFEEYLSQVSQTQLTLRNSFQGGSDRSDGEFEVDEGSLHFRCTINGKVKSGEITIKITYPSGKVFKDLTINSAAEITFSQALTISKEKGDKYIGTWGYEVEADEAEGSYMLSIMAN